MHDIYHKHYLKNKYYLPSNELSPMFILDYLILITTLVYRCYYSHFTDSKTELQNSDIVQVCRDGPGIQTQASQIAKPMI